MDVGRLAWAEAAGRALHRAAGVGLQQPVSALDQVLEGGVVELADRRPWVDALEEQGLGVVQRPDPGQQPLIQQGLADGSLWVAPKVGQGSGQVPVGTQQIWPEVTDE